jgi:ribose transport system permease protein
VGNILKRNLQNEQKRPFLGVTDQQFLRVGVVRHRHFWGKKSTICADFSILYQFWGTYNDSVINHEKREKFAVKVPSHSRWIWLGSSSKGLIRIASLLIVFAFYSIFARNFFSIITLLNLLTQTSPLIILAIGETLVLVVGGIDLSVGAMTVFGGAALAVFLQAGMPTLEAIVWSCLVCGVLGLANGILVARLRLPSFIITFAMAILIPAVSKYFQDFMGYRPDGLNTITDLPRVFRTVAYDAGGAEIIRFPGVSMGIIIMIFLVVLSHLFLAKTRYGRSVYLVGSNRVAAHLSGIKVVRIKILGFVFASMMAGLSGVLITFQGGQPAGVTQGFEMIAIECAMIGGASIFGGTGSIAGTVVGSLLIGTLTVGLQMMSYWDQNTLPFFLNSLIFVSVVALDQKQQRREAALPGFVKRLTRIFPA